MSENTSVNSSTLTVDSSTKVRRPPGAARILFAVSTGLVFFLTLGAAVFAGGLEKGYSDLGIKNLPVPTELVFAVARVLKDPVWLAVIVAGCLFLVLLALKGFLDVLLKFLIGLNFLWLVVFLLATLVTWGTVSKLLGRGEKQGSAFPQMRHQLGRSGERQGG